MVSNGPSSRGFAFRYVLPPPLALPRNQLSFFLGGFSLPFFQTKMKGRTGEGFDKGHSMASGKHCDVPLRGRIFPEAILFAATDVREAGNQKSFRNPCGLALKAENPPQRNY